MTVEPLLTVVVCTHNRSADLELCIAALARLTDPVEVIIVDSASNPSVSSQPEIVTAVARFERSTIIRVDRPGLSHARNVGIARARCEIVAFIDDDAFVRPDWAGRLVAGFDRPDVACVGGSCEAVFETERPAWLSDRLLQFAGATRFGVAPRAASSSSEFPFGANMAFRRSDLMDVGGFDEALGRNGKSLLSGEESGVMDMLIARGRTVWLQPDATVDHLIQAQRTRAPWYWSRMWWAGVGRARGSQTWTTGPRIVAAAPVRAAAWLATRDRVYLFRLAETAGYLSEQLSRMLRFGRGGRDRRKAA